MQQSFPLRGNADSGSVCQGRTSVASAKEVASIGCMRRDPEPAVTVVCRLSPRLRVAQCGNAAWLIATRPLRLLRVQPRVVKLLERLRVDPDVGRVVKSFPDLRWGTVIPFLERLADEGLVRLVWSLPDEMLPSVSVVIPVRNRPAQLNACLAALERLDYPRERLEVLVVDDASSDDTVARAETWRNRLPLRVIRLPVPVGAAACRNHGAELARGDILAFTDSDCRPHPRWLRELVPEFVRSGVVAVGGAVLPADNESWLDRYEAVESPLTHGPEPARVQPRSAVPYLVTANLLVRRRALLEIGGFARIHPGEDVDLVWRLCERGGRILYRPAGIVLHDHRDRLWPFLRRRAAYASSEVVLVRRHPHARHRMTVPVAMLASIGCGIGAGRQRGLVILAVLPLLADVLVALQRIRRLRAPVSLGELVLAEFRGMLVACYWIGRTISRYYSWPALVAGVLFRRRGFGRWLSVLAGASLLGTASIDYIRKRPSLDPVRFLLAHLCDDLANNAGLLVGCLRSGTIRPLLVELSLYWPRLEKS